MRKLSLKFKIAFVTSIFFALSDGSSLETHISNFILIYAMLTIWTLLLKLLFPGLIGLEILRHKQNKDLKDTIEEHITGKRPKHK